MAKPQFSSEPVDLGNGFTVEFTFAKGGIVCEWTPDLPRADQVDSFFMIRYQAALQCFVAARMTRFIGDTGPVTTVLREGGAHG